MAKIKRFIVFTLFSLFFSMFSSKRAEADYTLTFKPKMGCGEGQVMVASSCVDESDIVS